MKSLSHRPVTSFHSLKLLHAHIPAWDLKINPKSFFSCVTMKLHKYGRFNIAIMARARILNVDRSQSSSPSSVSSSISSASSSSSWWLPSAWASPCLPGCFFSAPYPEEKRWSWCHKYIFNTASWGMRLAPPLNYLIIPYSLKMTPPEQSPSSTFTSWRVILGPISWSLTAHFEDALLTRPRSPAKVTVAASSSASLSDPYPTLPQMTMKHNYHAIMKL